MKPFIFKVHWPIIFVVVSTNTIAIIIVVVINFCWGNVLIYTFENFHSNLADVLF